MKALGKTLLVLLLLGAIGAGLRRWGPYAQDTRHGNPGETTATVARRDFISSVLATGAVKPQVGAEVRVGARISGKVERLLANIGDIVKKGQVIAELESDDLTAIVSQREAELADAKTRHQAETRLGPLRIRQVEAKLTEAEAAEQLAETKRQSVEQERGVEVRVAEAEVERWRASVELAEQEFTREQALRKQKVVPVQDVDRAREALSTAQAQIAAATRKLELAKTRLAEHTKQARKAVAQAKAAVQVADRALGHEKASHEERVKQIGTSIARAEATLQNAKVQRSYATLTAPITGVVGSVATQEGETVAAGLNAPTFVTIIDLDRLQVDAYVDEVDIGRVKTGQRAIFTVDAFPSREFEGTVEAIYPKAVLQDNVVYYDVVIEITSQYDGLLRPEMTTNVTLLLETRKDVLAIPTKAIRRSGGRNTVHVAGEGSSEPREIRVGWRDGSWVEVVAGLREGETVLVGTARVSPSGR